MDCFTQSPSFTLPLYSPEYNHNVQEYEKTAEKALRNINLIYKEIMAPKSYDLEDLETDNVYNEENISQSCEMQNHYVRTCCNSVKELCIKCDRFISRCVSCNHCECYATNNNRIQRTSCNGRSGDYHSSNIQQHFEVKCTVPKPFSFCSKIEDYRKAKENKIFKLKQDRETKIESELKVRPNFKPVPKSTHLNLYSQMAQQEEQRKIKRREECQEKLNNTKPFNLLSSSKNYVKAKSTTNLNPENTQFRAKPVPKHILSNRVTEKLKNKEEIRKLLIGERAKQTIEKSSLPFSQKTIPCTRSCVDLCGLNKTQNKEEGKPKDISEIIKRLYVRKCSETMENWNKRVLQVNTDKEKVNQKMYNPMNEYVPLDIKQLTKKEELPFVYFPVRMSSASLLREKQIREEIMAKKEKEKMKDEEVIKKRFNNDILKKLKNLIPPSEGEKEIEEKVKNFRVSQIKREQEYEKELEEIMKKVSEQNLLLERPLKVKQMNLNKRRDSSSDKESISDANETQESISSYSNTDSSKS